MTFLEVLKAVLCNVGRDDVAASLSEEPSGEARELYETAVLSISAAENELARYYLPLKHSEKLSSPDGNYPFSSFKYPPVRILAVKAEGGGKADYTLTAEGMISSKGGVEVEYYYVPPAKNGLADGDKTVENGDLAALGATAEVCLVTGEAAAAEIWENRYRAAIDRARYKSAEGMKIPPRRWV